MNKLKQSIEKILKQEESFIDPETKEVNYSKVKDSADKVDGKLIALLAGNKETKDKFFTKIKDVYVFNSNDFKFFLDENRINNSYTQYANQIGLSNGADLLKNNTDVVLDFPFKDCVLEGGQSIEEGSDTYFEYSDKSKKYEKKETKRSEIFFNQILAHDEIDRLFDKKALVSWKRFTKDSTKNGDSVREIKRDEKGLIKENLIIKGNNLLALHSLKSEFREKVKLIYIDPPYNTGNDGFKYNDNFNHSTWLAFMKNRLEIAKELLRNDGVIFVQADYNEAHYLKILLDEIFGRERFVNEVIWKRKFGTANETKRFATAFDNIYLYSKTADYKINLIKERNTRHVQEYIKSRFTRKDSSGIHKGRLWMPYPLANPGKPTKNLTYEYKGYSAPIKGWRMTKESLEKLDKDGRLYFPEDKKQRMQEKKFLDEYEGQPVDTLWTDIFVINSQSKEALDFDGQKPEELLRRIIQIGSDKDDIVLDYHAGTGTTLAVAHKIGRQYIGIEQMDYIHDLPEARLKEVIKGDQIGISKSVNWKGGGSFIYCELAEWNEQAIKEVSDTKDLKALEKMFDNFCEKYFLNYNVKIKEFKEKVIKEENFKKLTPDEQKRMFLTMLDLNQLYVQESEMADKRFGISKEDQKLTKEFYQNK